MEEVRDKPSMATGESQEQERRYQGSTRKQEESPLCYTDGHMSPQKNAELEPQLQKYKGRVVLRGDIVKGDSGSYALFTEQGSSASQMTAAKKNGRSAKLPGCDGQAADAVSAYTQVPLVDAPRWLKNSKIRMSRCLDTSSTTQMAKIMKKC